MAEYNDLVGKRFGRLLVLERLNRNDGHTLWWRCQCDCGEVKDVRGSCLKRGDTKSCGCLNAELSGKRGRDRLTKHGWYGTRLYNIWCGMKERCLNPKNEGYKNYGGRGISLCDEWVDAPAIFCEWAMANGYKDGLTIDRIDTNGDYSPDNCRWIDMNAQQRNKRNNQNITYKGETKCVAEWARELGINKWCIYPRIKKGWTEPEELLFGRRKG